MLNIENDKLMNFRVLTLNQISKTGLARFSANIFDVSNSQEEPDAILVRSADLHQLELNPSLKAIGRAGAGTNNVPVTKCTEKWVVVFNAPGANANAVKELIFGTLFSVLRNIPSALTYTRSLVAETADLDKVVEKNKALFKGSEMKGKRLGVVGLGAIGTMVANTAISLGLEVEGYDPFLSVEKAWGLSREVICATSFEKLIGTSDFVTLHVPLTPDTKELVNDTLLARFKRGAVLLNFSRGEIVDTSAIARALDLGQLSYYINDFPTLDLVGHPKVSSLPHLGASTQEAEENCATMVVDQVSDFLLNGNIKNSVNFPDCFMDCNGKARLTIINRNIPNMVGQITTILAHAQVNILEMVNKSRGDIAYTIVDSHDIPDIALLDQIRQIQGVVTARLIKR